MKRELGEFASQTDRDDDITDKIVKPRANGSRTSPAARSSTRRGA
jgi:hypothetical protein